MKHFDKVLQGGDLRSIGDSNKVVSMVNDQESFDALFEYLFHTNRQVVMRVADAIEKITLNDPGYLKPHKKEILQLCNNAENNELKWHLALLAPRLLLSKQELEKVWQTLSKWAINKQESRIVRVNSVQGLCNLLSQSNEFAKDFYLKVSEIEKEHIPSLNARIRKLKNANR